MGSTNTFIDINCSRLQRYNHPPFPEIANMWHLAYHDCGFWHLSALQGDAPPYLYIQVPMSDARFEDVFSCHVAS